VRAKLRSHDIYARIGCLKVIATQQSGLAARTRKERGMGSVRTSRDEDPHALTERLLRWREGALRAGRETCSEVLLLLAWKSYDRPPAHAKPTL
jgi:hypothetical protein